MKIFNALKNEFRNLQLSVSSRVFYKATSITNIVPYICQFATPSHAEKVLKGGASEHDDPNWANSGAESIEEYGRWAPALCGMACAAMALAYFKNSQAGTVKLGKEAELRGVYAEEGDSYSGMRYRKFAAWIKGYCVRATIYTRLDIRGIKKLLSGGKLVIASVNPNIRGYDTAKSTQRAGHLVLVTGYNDDSITIHNPSGFVSLGSQANHTMPTATFCKYFAGRGIALTNLSKS